MDTDEVLTSDSIESDELDSRLEDLLSLNAPPSSLYSLCNAATKPKIIKPKEVIFDDKRPIMNIQYLNHTLIALLDTGCTHSFISLSTVKRLNISYVPTNNNVLLGQSGSEAKCYGRTSPINISANNHASTLAFFIMDLPTHLYTYFLKICKKAVRKFFLRRLFILPPLGVLSPYRLL
jgi:hypothetical protein